MPPSGRGTAIMAWFSMYSCSWWPTRYSPSMTSSARARAGFDVALGEREMGELLRRQRADRRPPAAAQCADGCARLASRSVSRSGAASSATGSAWCRISSTDEHRLVVRDEADTTLSPGMSLAVRTTTLDQSKSGSQVDAQQPRVRLGRADRVAVPGAGEDQIVGVQGRAGQLGRALAAQWVCARAARHRSRRPRARAAAWPRRASGNAGCDRGGRVVTVIGRRW